MPAPGLVIPAEAGIRLFAGSAPAAEKRALAFAGIDETFRRSRESKEPAPSRPSHKKGARSPLS
jgi:hypothetical protein